MKTEIFKLPWRAFARRRCGGWPCAAMAGLLLASANLSALPVVDTVSGGPRQGNSSFFGSADGDTANIAQFHTPIGLAFGTGSNSLAGNILYVADRDNNAIRKLDLDLNQTITFLTSKISKPVGVALDGGGNLYVLNRGNGNNGTVLEFNRYGNFLGTNALALTNANGLALDDSTNIYVTVNGNAVIKIAPGSFPGIKTTVVTVTNANTSLQGITTLSSGFLAVCDAGRNGILKINPVTGTSTNLTGFNGAGDNFGIPGSAQFNQPYGIAAAGAGMLVVADYGNHRVKTVDASGNVCSLYGVCSNDWVTGTGTHPGWWDGNGCPCQITCQICNNYAEARFPAGVTVAPDGSVYTTEDYYHLIRHVQQTGLAGPENASAPTILTQPQGQTVNLGGFATFSVTATGLQPLTYQWRLNGADIADATGSSLTRGNVQVADGGNYSVVVANNAGSVTSSNAALIVIVPPTITTHPQSQEIGAGDNATFFVVASGTAPLSYQWRLNGANIASATQSSFTRLNAQPADAGNYTVVVTNTAGSVTSSNAVLTIDTAPSITVQPLDQIVRLGSNAAFNVTAVGGSPLTYQWRLNGVPVPGATSTNLVFLGVQSSNAGPYTVVVANPFGSVTSSVAQLVVLTPPTISPNTGYFPMGQTITVNSGLPDVFYTTDGTEPTPASARVVLSGSVGSIRWINPTNDLTGLKVKAFVGTNTTITVSGVPAATNNVGVPPGPNTNLFAGIGSKIVVPIVANLRTNDQVKSYQFKVEITPNGGAPMISDQFLPLNVTSNDFIRVITSAQGDSSATISVLPYTNGPARGLEITAIGTNANVFFQRFAIVAMLAVPIPGNAAEGQTYSINVLNGSATSDGIASPVAFPAMPAATILVTNLTYTVGDSAPGGWYNAGEFGNTDLDNSDVNNAFYAAAGLRLPYPFTDVYDAMDAYPEDDFGFVGGDGEIRFLDWQVILQRSLRQIPYFGGTNNWKRAWSSAGERTNLLTTLPLGSPDLNGNNTVAAPWNCQAKVGAVPVGNAVAGGTVNVPVYVRTAYGATLAGLQFRCLVTPDNGGPALNAAPTFIPAGGLTAPIQQSFKVNEFACGWSLNILNGVNCAAHTSNYLGTVRFTMPPGAVAGHTYTVAFANADGAPDLHTQYTFETKRATVSVGTAAAPVTDLTSDDWKAHFFGNLADPNADPNADPDHDGVVNWAEYVAGTDPTDAASRLKCDSATRTVGGQRQIVLNWLSAPGKAYEVLVSTSPNGGPWTTRSTIYGDGNAAQYVETNLTAGAQFYRLRVAP